jgi:prevent-host-death family protein
MTTISDNVTTRVGIRELKARLSHYLDRAASGESIVITDRGKAKAELRALSPVERRIQQGIEEGWIRPGRPGGLSVAERRRYKGRMTIAEAMAEDREE